MLACCWVVSQASDILEGGKAQRGLALEWQAEELELDPVGNGGGAWSLCAARKRDRFVFWNDPSAVSRTNSGGAPWRNGGH